MADDAAMKAAAETLKRAAARVRLALEWPGDDSPLRCPADSHGRQVLGHHAGPIAGHLGCVKDAAGYYFHLAALKQAGLWDEPEASSSSGDDSGDDAQANGGARAANGGADDLDEPPPGATWKQSRKKKDKKDKKKDGKDDPYKLLGLQHERWMTTDAQLKAAYRRACLENHPDKKLAGVTDPDERQRVEDHFKAIQEAYETLSDPQKRREFDSTDEFDDSLPLECDPKDFYKVFGPAFRRNVRWSFDAANAPDFGDDTTPWAAVDKFYNFWYTFKSWREFPHPDEEDVEQAESREHRRWIERNNSKLREKGKKDEGRRLREFVEAAYRLDPRVQRHKEEERAEKERKRQEKEDARRRAQEEEERKRQAEEEERRKAEEAAKQAAEEAKKAREVAKQAVKAQRKRLRALAEGGPQTDGARLASEDDVERLCSRLEGDALAALCQRVESALLGGGAGCDEAARAAITQQLTELDRKDEEEVRAKEAARAQAEAAARAAAREEHARKVAAMREWSEEELRLLDKAQAKFPMGTPKRWEQVAAYVRTRTLDEVLLMVKERQGASATRVKAQEDWKAARKRPAEVTSAADTRVQAFTDVSVKLVGEAAEKLMGASSATSIPSPTASTSSAASTSTTATAAATAAATASSKKSGGGAAAASGEAKPSANAATGASSKKVVSADSGEWNEEQELALVKALKTYPKDLGQERWEKVASMVPGKTKAQCFKRFKELREAFRSKKDGGDGDMD